MATITITTTSAEDARIVQAFGRKLGLGRNATGAEVKAAIATWIKHVVQSTEQDAAAEAAASQAPVNPT